MLNINIIFRLLLTLNSTFLLVIIYLVQKGITLQRIFLHVTCFKPLPLFPSYVSYALYISIPLFLTFISILLRSKLGEDSFKAGEVVSIEYANNSFLPSYLGYFFVALSVGNLETLIFVYILLFIFTFLSQALYFNPLFLVFGYNFYNVTTTKGVVIFLISRKKFRNPKDIIINTHRINNYTFIDGGK